MSAIDEGFDFATWQETHGMNAEELRRFAQERAELDSILAEANADQEASTAGSGGQDG